MNELIKIYNDCEEYKQLIPDSQSYEKAKNIYLSHPKKKYEIYPNLFDFFDRFELKNGLISIEDYLHNFNQLLKQKLIKDKKSYDEILTQYDFDGYHSLCKFLLDLIVNEEDEEEETEDTKIETNLDDISNIKDNFFFHKNQIRGIEKAIETNFATGIHSQATACGKTIMELKILWEYHKTYPTHNLMWFCERIDIPRSLFFTKVSTINLSDKYVYNQENFDFFRNNDIFDFSQFNIIDFINNKPRKLAGSFLENSMRLNGKPYFIIINRAYATSKSDFRTNEDKTVRKFYKYEEIIDYTMPQLIAFDECHSGMAEKTYEFLLYAKHVWNSKIHGLSATAYRKGISNTSFSENLISSIVNIDKYDTISNLQKLINIFHKHDNHNELNIISWCNIKEAIEEGYILEPIFHWYNISNKSNDKNDEIEINSTFSVLNETLRLCEFKKCIVWCRMIDLTKESFDNFKKYQGSYDILKNMKAYIDYSRTDNGVDNVKYCKNYDEFYKSDDNTILFCACKYREGSDIPFLNCELLLDKVKDRTEIVYIQSIGRVLRRSIHKEKGIIKSNGHIIDSISTDNNNVKAKNIIMKVLKYYLELFDISFKNDATQNQLNKLQMFNQIMSNIKIEPEKKSISIMLNNDKKITIDLKKLDINTLEWKDLIKHFHEILREEMEFDEYDKFIKFKNDIKKYNFQSDIEYKEKALELELPIDPEIIYEPYWKGWYDFFSIDTTIFISDFYDWKKKVKELNINSIEEYYESCKIYDFLPIMPKELYKNMASITEYFNDKIVKIRR